MPRNTYSALSPQNTVLFAKQIHDIIGPEQPSDYGTSTVQLGRLASAYTSLGSQNAAVVAAKAAYHAVIDARDAQEAATKEAIASIAATVYSTPTATPEMIRAIGLQPRATTRTKVVPVTPTGLTVKVETNGDLVASWKRSGNAQNVIFRLEEQTSDGIWSFADETTACRLTLKGYAAGEPVAFRIVATKNGISATPTGMVTAYQTAVVAPALRLAA